MGWKYIVNLEAKGLDIPEHFIAETKAIIASNLSHVAKCKALHALQLQVVEHMNELVKQSNLPATLEQLDEQFMAHFRTAHIFRK